MSGLGHNLRMQLRIMLLDVFKILLCVETVLACNPSRAIRCATATSAWRDICWANKFEPVAFIR
jgi:hypothetical protein